MSIMKILFVALLLTGLAGAAVVPCFAQSGNYAPPPPPSNGGN
jgi:hypothetical protein